MRVAAASSPRATTTAGQLSAAAIACLFVAAAIAWAPLEAVVAALAVAAAALVLAWPPAGLVGAVFAVPFGSLVPIPLGGASLTLAPVLLGWTAVGWAIRTAARAAREPPGRLRRTEPHVPQLEAPLAAPLTAPLAGLLDMPLAVPLGLYLGALALSAWRAPDALAAFFETARWGELALAVWLTSALCRDLRARRVVLASLLVAGATAAGTALVAPAGGADGAFALLGTDIQRAAGTFGQPNPFGAFMNMAWPIGAGLALAPFASSGKALGPAWAGLGTAAAACCLAGLYLSWSRGAWLATAAAAGAMVAVWACGAVVSWRGPLSRPRVGRLAGLWAALVAATAFVAFGGTATVPESAAGRLASIGSTMVVWGVADAEVDDANFATVERVAHWQAAAAMWADKPWLGQGPGHFEIVYDRFRLPRWSEPLGHAHNYYLHALAETGLVGLAAYLALLAAAAALTLHAALAPEPSAPFASALGLGAVGVLTAVAVHSLVDNVYVHDMTVYLGVLLGLVAASLGTRRSRRLAAGRGS